MPHRVGEAVGYTAIFGGSIAVAATDSVNMGNTAAGITAVCLALGTGLAYLIKNLGPAWIQFRKDNDEMLRGTFAGKLQSLEDRLAEKDSLNGDQARRIEALKETADLLAEKVKESQELAKTAKIKAEQLERDLKLEREKRHELAEKQQADALKADEARMNLNDKLKENRVAVNQNSKAITQLADVQGIVTVAPALITETAVDMPVLSEEPSP